MRPVETITTAPIPVRKSVRGEEIRALTSARAGKIIPLFYAPLLREDRVSSGKIRVHVDMAETVRPLMNAVRATFYAHFIPFTAFERFAGGHASFDRSYSEVPEPYNDEVIPFFDMMTFDKDEDFWIKSGIQWIDGAQINSAPVEAFNVMVNWRRAMRSDQISLRGRLATSACRGFWQNPNLWHIVPDFEAAMIDGEVQLLLTGRVPVSGIGLTVGGSGGTPHEGLTVFQTDQDNTTDNGETTYPHSFYSSQNNAIAVRVAGDVETHRADIWAEMQGKKISISLANIEAAKQTAAFAKMRERFTGLSDDHLIDLLMEGVRVPDESLRQPILLDRKSTIFGYSERFATDGANLEVSVTTGMTMVELTVRTPPMNTGGIIWVTCEIMPEALLERQKDKFLSIDDPSQLPQFQRDFLDPEKVEIVNKNFVDVLHANGAETFGYAPLNHQWKRSLTRIGGRFYRPNTDVFNEDRQRFWSLETLDPELSEDFYLAPANVPHTVFADADADPFEILTTGSLSIVGNTVFGQAVTENDGNYAAVDDKVPYKRIAEIEAE